MVHCFFAVSNVDSFSCSFLWFMFTRATFLRRYLLVTVFPQRVLSPSNLIWFFFSTFLFSLNNRSPSSGGDDPGIKQIKLFVLFLEGEDQRRNSDALPSLMGAMAELFIKTAPMLYNALQLSVRAEKMTLLLIMVLWSLYGFYIYFENKLLQDGFIF